ncbi:site-specific recombinase DNA invertase Pin [Planobispora rosea]|uniref:Site-specific recombinase DNA invertase Pin n=1 Tax=Planobispora rosea TaxID=35762 RepID=A0A8J3S5Z4_PLARO|nr:recombinase family protein [Planobispora rosea]GGS94711.1 site-specific recombinase DNA invertase Pin [Planobispora rosea]GIH87419.1 site-specific recombinase DNA invertase Pin [Planobispora rosea]
MTQNKRGKKAEPQLRAGVYARLSETYDAAESVPTQLENGARHAARRGDRLVASFKDDGVSGYKEISRDGFMQLIAAIERGELDVVIVRDIDRLTRNLDDWNQFERACVRNGVILSAYTGGDLDLSTPEGAYYGGMETLRARRESAVKSARVREAVERNARKGRRPGAGKRRFGYRNIYDNPHETDRKRRVIRIELDPAEPDLIREAATRLLDHGESLGGIVRDWQSRNIPTVTGSRWDPNTLRGILTSAFIAGLREWEGEKYPGDWPAIIDIDTHERLRRLFSDPGRKADVTRRQKHLLSGILLCSKCEKKMYFRGEKAPRANSYACAWGMRGGCGGTRIKADSLEEYVTGAVLDALESPRIQEALRKGTDKAEEKQRILILKQIKKAKERKEEARLDYGGEIIDREEWLDIRAQVNSRITELQREYDRLSGKVVILGDIPPGDEVRDAWEGWTIERKRAAIRSVLIDIKIRPVPEDMRSNLPSLHADAAQKIELELKRLRQRVDFNWRV